VAANTDPASGQTVSLPANATATPHSGSTGYSAWETAPIAEYVWLTIGPVLFVTAFPTTQLCATYTLGGRQKTGIGRSGICRDPNLPNVSVSRLVSFTGDHEAWSE
jgi:hypothetical protein